MSDRHPATDKGTADRVEADNGGYWVKLVSKQALRREGECMDNCLARGEYEDRAGEEDLVSMAIWSLRKATGISYLTTSVYAQRDDTFIGNTEGPKGSQPSVWSIKQLRHLVAAFREAGATLRVPETIGLTGADGRTWRPDKAPQEMRDAVETRLPSDPPEIFTSFESLGTVAVQNEMQALGASVQRGLSSMVEAIGDVATGWRKASIEARINQIEEALASGHGIGSASVGTTVLRRLYAQLETLGGPPVQQVRFHRSVEPGISPAA